MKTKQIMRIGLMNLKFLLELSTVKRGTLNEEWVKDH